VSNSAKKNSQESNTQQLSLVPRPSHSLFWNSTLFNDVYLQNDVPFVHKSVWDGDENEFESFLNNFRNFCETFVGDDPDGWSERTTINRVVKPILKMLGWTSSDGSSVEPWLEDEPFSFPESDGVKNYKPDFIVVDNHKQLKHIQAKSGASKLEEARRDPSSPGGVILTIEAKYWDRIEECRQNRGENSKRADKRDKSESSRGLDFDDQCLKYMEMLNNEYGILTDGKTWRLYNLSVSSPSYKPYFQFNLGHLIRHVNNSDFLKKGPDYELFYEQIKYFFFIFRKKSLYTSNGEELFVDELLNYSKKYVTQVEQDLKHRFLNAMSIACNGFARAARANGESVDLDTIRNIAESHIFNILFLKYCEARNILPIKQDPEGYRLISISNTLDKLEGFDPDKEEDDLNFPLLRHRFKDISYAPSDTKLYDRLLKLTKIVQDGNRDEFPGFAIKGFRETVFSVQEWKFAQRNKLSNKEMVRILFELGYSRSDIKGRRYQQIPYNSFSPRQLGSIYESFLEYRLELAASDMAFVDKQWKPANLASDKIRSMEVAKVFKGNLFFTPDNKNRKDSGSYYTPDYVVQYIVKKSLGAITKDLSSAELLKVRLCDPAMGSGHFLSAALSYLAAEYLRKLENETLDDLALSLNAAKQLVLKNCIYGVDLNSRAVKLAKMSLWLESASSNSALENLEDQLLVFNSLKCDISEKFMKSTKGQVRSFDCILGNPPWGATLSEADMADFNRRFPEASYKLLDTFKYFTVMSMKHLCENGVLGYIIPRSILTHIGCRDVRKFLLNYKVGEIVDLGDNVFDDVTCPSAIVVCTNSDASKTFGFKDVGDSIHKEIDLYSTHASNLEVSDCLSRPNFEFAELDDNSEALKNAKCPKLKDVANIFDSGLDYSRKELGDAVFYDAKTREDRLDIPVLRGKNINRFQLTFNGKWLRGNWKEIETRQKKKDSKTRLKVNVKAYEDSPKILVRQTADEVIATLDVKKFYNQKSLLSIHPKDKSLSYLLLGILNSAAITTQYRTLVGEEGQAFSQVKKNKLEELLIPIGVDKIVEKKIEVTVKALIELNDIENEKYPKLMAELNTQVDKLFSSTLSRSHGKKLAA
jgi:type I restriction-modification system DNA methylase subunit